MGTGKRIATPVCALARNDKLGTFSAVGAGFPVPPSPVWSKEQGIRNKSYCRQLIPYYLFLFQALPRSDKTTGNRRTAFALLLPAAF